MAPVEREREVEERIAGLAASQHGVVTRAQLLRAGVTVNEVRRRITTSRLVELHRGVYLVGPMASPRAAEMAAVLACGPRAYVSHRSAAWLWALLPRPEPAGRSGAVEVRVAANRRVRRSGIRARRTERLEPRDVALVDGIPVTSVARTLVDLAGVVRPRELERATARAERQELVTRDRLLAFVARHRREPGVGVLAGILGQEGGPALTRSVLEDRFGDEVKEFGLPKPRYNVVVEGYELDVWWPRLRHAVELDGAAYHRSWRSQRHDRRRDTDLAAAGITVIRVTWDQLVHDTKRTMMRIGQALALARDRLGAG
jgi:very-short-patch-repair endonuclease